jgi:hypothetical protein
MLSTTPPRMLERIGRCAVSCYLRLVGNPVRRPAVVKLRRHPRSTFASEPRFVNSVSEPYAVDDSTACFSSSHTSDSDWPVRCLLPYAVSEAAVHANRHDHKSTIGIDVGPMLPTSECLQSKAVLFFTSQSVNWRPEEAEKE